MLFFLNYSKSKFALILFYILVVKWVQAETGNQSVAANKETKSSMTLRLLKNKEVRFNYEKINQAYYSELGINQM